MHSMCVCTLCHCIHAGGDSTAEDTHEQVLLGGAAAADQTASHGLGPRTRKETGLYVMQHSIRAPLKYGHLSIKMKLRAPRNMDTPL